MDSQTLLRLLAPAGRTACVPLRFAKRSTPPRYRRESRLGVVQGRPLIFIKLFDIENIKGLFVH